MKYCSWRGRLRVTAVTLAALALSACAGQLRPAPTANVIPGTGKAASVTVDDVTIIASAGAWHGAPRDLGREVMPILVTIDNGGSRPLSFKYDEIALVAGDGRRFAAIPPETIQGALTEPVSALPGPVAAPPYQDMPGSGLWYSDGATFGWQRWGGEPSYGWDPWYSPGPSWIQVRLPTPDMLDLALRNAVVAPGQHVQGFVYCQRVARKGTPVDLVLPLTDAETARSLAVVSIPFVFK